MKLTIAGGTYLEQCQFPEWNEVYGSGLRAAAAVTGLGGNSEFHTYVSTEHLPALRARAHELSIECYPTEIPRTVSFDYVHGFSTPQVLPPPYFLKRERQPALEISGDAVLRFGFIEGDAIVKGGGRVVYDPQNPHEPEPFDANGSMADSMAIVCNAAEGRCLTGESDPSTIATALIDRDNCEIAVVKCGSMGAFVAGDFGLQQIPAYKTEFVWPIGSGDVFAAVFAYGWALMKKDPVEAANMASRATAFYCEKRHLRFREERLDEIEFLPLPIRRRDRKPCVYLAGPFFSMPEIWLINQSRDALRSQGFSVFSPLHQVGRGPAEVVYEPDIDGIVGCDIVFACVDGLDAGTLFEIGYAKAMGKQVVAFVQRERPEDLKMLIGSGCIIEHDFVTAVYKAAWVANGNE